MPSDTKWNFDWSGSMEQLEERLAMSADPLGGLLGGTIVQHAIVDDLPPMEQHVESAPDFWIDSSDQIALEDQIRQIDQTLEEAHGQTGLLNVRTNYGFTGVGQTVAVIDSGIAYDHFALGGGYGSNYRVVGGWDFTGENDANPYDDGPSGSHGTHVAGIVGGDSGSDTGVAPGVDLVALRVFDDAGAGYFSWVENALDWIYTNRNTFENPITTVNLSLGVASWNAETIPSWANLEDEFAQLESVGIFTAVSAGNSFSSYNTTGLSYPAASSYVIPVMSTDDSGLMSYFSQRSSRAIAAPGRWITSTVPDYAGNNNGIADDYATMSGTSMAAPYVAGASVIVREAMQFVGYTNITQDMIYDHMMATADSFFDSATNQSYSRLNVQAAIDALMPADDFGSTIASAYGLGTVSGPMTMSGAIATLSDVDYFSFTAANTGTVTFSATNMTNDLTASWIVTGSQSLGALAVPGDSVTVDVLAGQDYTVGFASGNGLGYYDMGLSIEAANIGPVIVKTVGDQNGLTYTLDSENWLSVNGNRLWSKTQDFSIAANQNIVWHGTSGILQRHSAQGWETLDTNATKYLVNAKSKVYSLGTDNILSVNGAEVWGNTNDFHVDDSMAVYWHSSTSGVLQKLPNGGPWQTLDTSVREFAVRQDGVAFALTTGGNVTVDAAQTWTSIVDLRLDGSGQLIIESNDGSLQYQAGNFELSSDLSLQTSQAAVQVASTEDSTSSLATGSLEETTDLYFVAPLAQLSTQRTDTRSFSPLRNSNAGFTTLANKSGIIAETLQTNELTAQEALVENLLLAKESVYSLDRLLDEDSPMAFVNQIDSSVDMDAVDSLFERLGGIV